MTAAEERLDKATFNADQRCDFATVNGEVQESFARLEVVVWARLDGDEVPELAKRLRRIAAELEAV